MPPVMRPLAEALAEPALKRAMQDFSTGSEPWDVSISNYLRAGSAIRDAKAHVAATYLAVDAPEVLAGYVSVAWMGIQLTDQLRSAPRLDRIPYPSVPALLLGRLGVSVAFRGRGYGGALMEWVTDFALAAPAPCRFIGLDVDPANPAVSFYERYGFIGLFQRPEGGTLFMVQDLYALY